MPELSEQEILEKLREFDTPSITNVVATYPKNPLCLGLYEPWRQNWYTDQSVHCIYPELGRLVGYAVTMVYSLPDPNFNRLTMRDMAEAFIDKGASAYIGWSASVTLDYVDRAILSLLDNLLIKNLALQDAVAASMFEVGFDPGYNAHAKYYPASAGQKSIRQLLEPP